MLNVHWISGQLVHATGPVVLEVLLSPLNETEAMVTLWPLVPEKTPVDPTTVQGLVKLTVVGDVNAESWLAVAVPPNAIWSAFASVNRPQLIAVVTSKAMIVFFMFIFLFFRVVVVIEAFL